ncbi:MAG: hypothetical protein AAF512_05070, partial [Pseudomonadota bacterium]
MTHYLPMHFLARIIYLILALSSLFFLQPAQAQTNCAQVTEIPQADCTALLDLYNSTDGPSWTNNTGWNVSNTPCTDWHGVTCDAGRVSQLFLGQNQLNGTIPASINTLTGLASLRLFINPLLSGTIPDLSALTNLTVLTLSGNQLSGTIPDLSALTNLTLLQLNANQLTGPIPDLSTLTNLTNLQLENNQLTGSIPDLSALSQLVNLRLFENQLSGTIPASINALTNLTNLELWSNQLSGPIPDLSALANLTNLELQDNQLSGEIPDLSALTNLTGLSLNINQLSGRIPDVSALTDLTFLGFAANQLTGSIPDLSTLTNLTILQLHLNQLTGTIPDLSGLTKLHTLNLSANQLSGPIPDLSALTELSLLYLYINQLIGPIPDLSTLTNLTDLQLWSNNLSGEIPQLSTLTNLHTLSLGINSLTGEIPDLSALTGLSILELSENQLGGPIPDLSAFTSLTDLRLHSNQLTGAIPDLSALTNLTRLWLHNNLLTGSIPVNLSGLTQISSFLINNNCGLTATEPGLIAFLNDKQADWQTCEAVAEIEILRRLSPLADSPDTEVALGVTAPNESISEYFSVKNLGDTALILEAPVLNGADASLFSINPMPDLVIPPKSKTTFTATFTSNNTGTFNADFSLVSNDADESPFNFKLSAISSELSVAITEPANGSILDFSGTFRGTTQAAVNANNETVPVTKVELHLFDETTGQYALFTPAGLFQGFNSATPVSVEAFNPGGGLNNWQFFISPGNFKDESIYRVTAHATDADNRTRETSSSFTFFSGSQVFTNLSMSLSSQTILQADTRCSSCDAEGPR